MVLLSVDIFLIYYTPYLMGFQFGISCSRKFPSTLEDFLLVVLLFWFLVWFGLVWGFYCFGFCFRGVLFLAHSFLTILHWPFVSVILFIGMLNLLG